jgi:hypothetical protein
MQINAVILMHASLYWKNTCYVEYIYCFYCYYCVVLLLTFQMFFEFNVFYVYDIVVFFRSNACVRIIVHFCLDAFNVCVKYTWITAHIWQLALYYCTCSCIQVLTGSFYKTNNRHYKKNVFSINNSLCPLNDLSTNLAFTYSNQIYDLFIFYQDHWQNWDQISHVPFGMKLLWFWN